MLVSVRSVTKRPMRNRRTMVNVVVGDGSGRLHVVFFNQPWREKQLREGLQIALFGKAEVYRGGLQMTNPSSISSATAPVASCRSIPQSEKASLMTWEIAGWVEDALRKCAPRGHRRSGPRGDPTSARIGRPRRSASDRSTRPRRSRRRSRPAAGLAFDELLRVQTTLVMRKRMLERESKAIRHKVAGELTARLYSALPFELTGAQRRAIAEIEHDLAGPHPMHRLLQGDVGSGKTLVAVSAMLTAVQGGHQGALMAPTEVLAEQHATSCAADARRRHRARRRRACSAIVRLRVELLTNRVTGADRRDVLAGLADGTVDIGIGTHALIQEGVRFHSLGVVVVDEQHRFGVEQRAALRSKGDDDAVPDVLVMTATPIPRTAAMTVYGDLDVSVLDELPPGRTPIVTRWADGPLMEQGAWATVRDEVAEGRQAYVVCPLIEESEKLEVASAQETFDRLSAGELKGLRLGLLHGRLPSVGEGSGDGAVPSPRARCAGCDDGDRGRRRRAERDGDGDPRRGSLRHRPAAPTARPRRSWSARVDVLAGHSAGGRGEPARQSTCRGLGRLDRRLRTGRGRPRPARRRHDHEHRSKGSQRPQARVAATRSRAGGVGPRRRIRDRRRRSAAGGSSACCSTSSACCSAPKTRSFSSRADRGIRVSTARMCACVASSSSYSSRSRVRRPAGAGRRRSSPQPGGKQLLLQSVTDPKLQQFVDVFQSGPQTPEPGVTCRNSATETI